MEITEFFNVEVISKGRLASVCRAQRKVDHRSVLLTVLEPNIPLKEKERFRRASELTRSLDGAGVPRVLSLNMEQDPWLMVQEDVEAEPLTVFNLAVQLALPQFLRLATAIVSSVQQLHLKRVQHNALHPANIMVSMVGTRAGARSDTAGPQGVKPSAWRVTLINLYFATRIPGSSEGSPDLEVRAEMLPYLSPEQTGRMDGRPDQRSDLYALGAVLYELLAGRRPFEEEDAEAWINAHMTRQPDPPDEIAGSSRDTSLVMVSRIIMKLLAKNPEERYQSARGVLLDLEECLTRIEETGEINEFPLGKGDVSDQLCLPHRIYGRKAEKEKLVQAVERTSGGGRQLVLVTGYSGVGKTTLVNEIQVPVAAKGGLFLSGKFDQYQRQRPYGGVVNAFRAFLHNVLGGSDEELQELKQAVRAAVEPNGQVLMDVLPELAWVLGPQPAAPPLGPVESQNRFNLVFGRFLSALSGARPLVVLFLDDLQWVDPASLTLMQTFLEHRELHNFLLVGAYRENEVHALHPLRTWSEEMREAAVLSETVRVPDLAREEVNVFVADVLHTDATESRAPAHIVHAKTGGNPLFVRQMLHAVEASGALYYSRKQNRWAWDMDALRSMDISENVVELLIRRIRMLPVESRRVLAPAACLGNSFSLEMVALAASLPADRVRPRVEEALAEELLVAVDGEFRFSHDRVQQTVYSLIPEEERPALCQRIGTALLNGLAGNEREDRLFDIVHLINSDLEVDRADQERYEFASLNLKAGKKAQDSAAYESALAYYMAGIGFLGDAGWDRAYDLALSLHTLAAGLAYFCKGREETARLAEQVLKHARTLEGKLPVYRAELRSAIVEHKPLEAIALARRILASLGAELPEDPDGSQGMAELRTLHADLSSRDLSTLEKLPDMNDPACLAAMEILTDIYGAMYVAAPQLLAGATAMLVRMSVEKGTAPQSAMAYVAFGMKLCHFLMEIDSGFRFGEVGLRLLDREGTEEIRAKTVLLSMYFTRPWKERLREQVPPMEEACRVGLNNGDFEFAGNLAACSWILLFHAGTCLDTLTPKAEQYAEMLRQFRQEYVLQAVLRWQQVLENLRGGRPQENSRASRETSVSEPWILEGTFYSEKETVPQFVAAGDMTNLHELYSKKMMLCYLFGENEKALENAEVAEAYLAGNTGDVWTLVYYFYDTLIRLSLLPSMQGAKREEALERVEANLERLRFWAGHAPMNFLHKVRLVEAEKAAYEGKALDAMRLYEEAISGARREAFLHEEALACELAANFCLAQNISEAGGFYMRRAHELYLQWGAGRKAEHLEGCHPDIFVNDSGKTAPLERCQQIVEAGHDPGPPELREDGKPSHTLFGELRLHMLLSRLMSIVLESGSADKGVLVLEDSGRLLVQGEARASDGSIRVMQSVPLSESESLCPDIVNATAQSLQPVNLESTSTDERFSGAPYFRNHQPAAILCLPIINRKKLVGVLYLENARNPSSFPSDRVRVLELLASQAATALENARAYHVLNQEIVSHRQAEQSLKRALEKVEFLKNRLEDENRYLQEELVGNSSFGEVIGQSAQLKYVLAKIESVASTETTVLIEGETGVGKDLFARAIHKASVRSDRPLIKVNCAAIPANLIESELFGHEKGSFTGAEKTRKGRFELADGGTIFLDEVGELPLDLQPKLLRVLQERAFERVGGNRTIMVNVRILAATNRNLQQEMKRGRFREDLYYRLSVYPLSVPPLRKRKDDIPLLVQAFVQQYSKKIGKSIAHIPPHLLSTLKGYSWPGNVRELQNVIERAIISSEGETLRLGETMPFPQTDEKDTEKRFRSLEDVERDHILGVLEACRWRISGKRGAAVILGLHPNTLRFRMKKLGIEKTRQEDPRE